MADVYTLGNVGGLNCEEIYRLPLNNFTPHTSGQLVQLDKSLLDYKFVLFVFYQLSGQDGAKGVPANYLVPKFDIQRAIDSYSGSDNHAKLLRSIGSNGMYVNFYLKDNKTIEIRGAGAYNTGTTGTINTNVTLQLNAIYGIN